ncbi:wee1-like protein kinase 1-A [Lineus longissimus]|uniref:wee1-like protein kinase 1-A n=1 Tax=Lineus longissimus TaxID=88925 RepID=UPI002B4EE7F3
MAFSRSRLPFEGYRAKKDRKNENFSNIAQALTFPDSDGENSTQDISMASISPRQNDAWDSPDSDNELPMSLCTPSSPKSSRCARSRRIRPPKFELDMDCQPDPEHVTTNINNNVTRSPDSSQMEGSVPPSPCPWTPPHKKLRALRLFDTPHTPKSLLEKARSRTGNTANPVRTRTPLFSSMKMESATKAPVNVSIDAERPQTNVNPFTPNNNSIFSVLQSGAKRSRPGTLGSILDDSTDEDLEDELPSNKKIALHEINMSRYNEEFFEMSKLGDGEFGSVHKCIHRLDGCPYAIKKSKMPVAGSAYERVAMNEVYAHAVLGKHPQVVRYFSAWAENDHMYIQNEYCNGGSLADVLTEQYKTGKFYSEHDLCQMLRQLAKGLKYIHSQHLVHLDLKPGNIFIHREEKVTNSPESGVETGEDEEDEEELPEVSYKIGDLGHVTSMATTRVEEGDCRYLPREILLENYNQLTKADVFSLALTMFYAAGGGELPKNGDKWHAIRDGILPYISRCSKDFNQLLQKMIDPDPSMRPTASSLTQHPLLFPYESRSRAELRKALNVEKFKNKMLSRQLIEATERQMQAPQQQNASNRNSRLVGKKVNRSMSLTVF